MDTSLMNTPLAPLDLTPDTPARENVDVFLPEGVCAKQIRFVIEDEKLASVDFTGGCDGNLKAMSTLLEGMPVEDVIDKLKGITCGKKTTSCADQLTIALAERTKSGK